MGGGTIFRNTGKDSLTNPISGYKSNSAVSKENW